MSRLLSEEQLERMTFRALERVRELGGDTWMAVFDQEMLDWCEQYWERMDPEERAEWEYHRQFRKKLCGSDVEAQATQVAAS